MHAAAESAAAAAASAVGGVNSTDASEAAAAAAAVAACAREPMPEVPGSILIEYSQQRVRNAVAEAKEILRRRSEENDKTVTTSTAAAEREEAAGGVAGGYPYGRGRALGVTDAVQRIRPVPSSSLATWSNV